MVCRIIALWAFARVQVLSEVGAGLRLPILLRIVPYTFGARLRESQFAEVLNGE